MKTLGIVPAAGEGSRWGGYYKEFLPYGNGKWLIDRTISAMKLGKADDIVVISNREKLAAHARHLKDWDNIIYTSLQRPNTGMWSGLVDALHLTQDYNYFAMPDTFYPKEVFMKSRELLKDYAFVLGVFSTYSSDRFGILYRNNIFDKTIQPNFKTKHIAWGTLSWRREVADFWIENKPKDFVNDALNMALLNFKWTVVLMDYYWDMASWEDYKEFLYMEHIVDDSRIKED
jgi:hypothetical protein